MDGLNILAISGWTQPTDSLANIAPHAHHLEYAHVRRIDAAHEALSSLRASKMSVAIQNQDKDGSPRAKQGARDDVHYFDAVIGWSLGGILARRMLIEGHIKTRALILISTPFQFVRDARMPHAMPPETFENFYANYRDDTHRTTQRFHGLTAKGDAHHKRILSEMEHHPEVLNADLWLPWLDELKIYSAANDDYSALPPTLMIYGEQDAIIRHEQGLALHALIPQSKLISLQGCGHAPHLHDEALVRTAVTNFVREQISGQSSLFRGG